MTIFIIEYWSNGCGFRIERHTWEGVLEYLTNFPPNKDETVKIEGVTK